VSIFKAKRKAISSPLKILEDSGPMIMSVEQRIGMTVSCRDASDLPKVKNAGKIIQENGKKLQIMHNGIKVLADGYYGDLISPIIEKLGGHHEPQEEKVFSALLGKIKNSKPVMIELGSFWAYYSLWFKSTFPDGTAICCEPDPENIKVGQQNMEINGFKEGAGLVFNRSAAGSEDGKKIEFELDSNKGSSIEVPIASVDGLIKKFKLESVDILHIDVQGAELDALKGAISTITQGKLRFVVVSTHHYVFSGDPMTHQKCRDFIVNNGGHIIASHNVIESFSGDGLIVASFKKEDRDFTVEISANTGPSLFRPYEEDIAILVDAFDKNNSPKEV
jgi:FkbM family methyltransferase